MSIAPGCKRTHAHAAARAQRQRREVVRFWRVAHADWFSHDPAFDHRFREQFLSLHLSAARREHEDWVAAPEDSLALLILLDQFPRNAFRGTVRMYADALARHYAGAAESTRHMAEVDANLRLLLCLPFAHSEDAGGPGAVGRAQRPARTTMAHPMLRRIGTTFAGFGRFPQRNVMLGRRITDEEAAFLDSGGFAG